MTSVLEILTNLQRNPSTLNSLTGDEASLGAAFTQLTPGEQQTLLSVFARNPPKLSDLISSSRGRLSDVLRRFIPGDPNAVRELLINLQRDPSILDSLSDTDLLIGLAFFQLDPEEQQEIIPIIGQQSPENISNLIYALKGGSENLGQVLRRLLPSLSPSAGTVVPSNLMQGQIGSPIADTSPIWRGAWISMQ